MKKLVVLFSLLSLAAGATPRGRKCSELLVDGLTLPDVFILLASRKLADDKHLPRSGAAAYRLLRVGESKDAAGAAFADLLSEYKVTVADWKSVEEVEFDNTLLGTDAFIRALSKVRVEKKK